MHSKNSQQVILFQNRQDYLAHFLQDMLHGCAWQRWYYSEFSGLKPLPLSVALRTAILDQIDIGIMALCLLPPAACSALLSCLTDHDIKQITDRLRLSEGSTQISQDALASTLRVFAEQQYFALFAENSIQQALYLAVQSSRCYPGASIKAIFAVTEIVLALQFCQRQCLEGNTKQHAAFQHGDFATLLAGCTASIREKLLQAMALPEQQRRFLLAIVMQMAESPPVTDQLQTSPGQSEYSRYGNAFLLLPYILQLPLAKLAEDLPVPIQDAKDSTLSSVAILSLLVISACQGAKQFAHAFGDPLLRTLCGIKGALTLQEAVDFINRNPWKPVSELLLAGIAEREKKFLPLQSHHLVYQATGLVITEDSQKGRWLQLHLATPIDAKTLAVTSDESLTDKHNADLKSLWLLNRYQLNAAAALLLMQLAQITLKEFAYRLPGFAKSSVAYLQLNFLAMSATMTVEEERILVNLSKVPLNVILNITGIVRQRYTLPEFDHRPIQLSQQE